MEIDSLTEVCAVTVTYGDRADMCIETCRLALAGGADHVVVVDNGSTPRSHAALVEFTTRPDATLVTLMSNKGSAVGFSTAMDAAALTGHDLVWLLDDDNWPAPDALDKLLSAREVLESRGAHRVAVCANRSSDPIHRLVSVGIPPSWVYPPRGSFMGFDALTTLGRILLSPVGALHRKVEARRIPYAPYGGLLLPVAALKDAAPNRDMVLYADDTEWSMRLASLGWRLYLVPDATIEDADEKWYRTAISDESSANRWTGRATRAYYGARNRVWIDARRADSPVARLRFKMNKALVFGKNSARSGADCPSTVAFSRGVADGESGQLGVHSLYGPG